MEEVDKIIIHSLKDIGCDVEDGVQNLGQFSTRLIVEAAVKCLEVINPGLGIPEQLPQNRAARFHMGTSIAEACKDLGYNGEVGYQTFLYSNVSEVRRVFMFLIEKLPKDTEKTEVEPDDPFIRLKHEIGKVVREQMAVRKKPNETGNIPFVSLPLETGITLPGQKMVLTPQEWREFCINKLEFITEQVDFKYFYPSIITLNAKGFGEKSGIRSKDITPGEVPYLSSLNSKRTEQMNSQSTWLSLRENVLFSTKKEIEKQEQITNGNQLAVNEHVSVNENVEETEESIKIKEAKEIEAIHNRLDNLQASVKTITSKIIKIEETSIQEENLLRDKIKDFEVRRKARNLLSDGESNMKKLEETIDTATQRLLALATQWEKHRKPLIDKYRETRKTICNKVNESEKQMETVRELKEKLEFLNKQIIIKETTKSKLEEEFETLPKDINRSAYTRRIMEIIGNIKKQREEIDKILKDTKGLQKDINAATGRLDRSFTVTDEVIFRNAKRDESSKRAYKLLVTLHTDCSDIVSMVEETGSIVREIRDLEDQIDVESSKNIGANLERIQADLQQMKAESTTLRNQLKQLSIT